MAKDKREIMLNFRVSEKEKDMLDKLKAYKSLREFVMEAVNMENEKIKNYIKVLDKKGEFVFKDKDEEEIEHIIDVLANFGYYCYEDNEKIILKKWKVSQLEKMLLGKEFDIYELDEILMKYTNNRSIFDRNSKNDLLENKSLSYIFSKREDSSGVNVEFEETGRLSKNNVEIVKITGVEEI